MEWNGWLAILFDSILFLFLFLHIIHYIYLCLCLDDSALEHPLVLALLRLAWLRELCSDLI